jgi:hypothetical protein
MSDEELVAMVLLTAAPCATITKPGTLVHQEATHAR